MSHLRVKTEYSLEGSYGSTEKTTLYAWHNNSCDVTSFYDSGGEFLFATHLWDFGNDLMDAILRLNSPQERNGDLADKVEYVDYDEWKEKTGRNVSFKALKACVYNLIENETMLVDIAEYKNGIRLEFKDAQNNNLFE